MLGASSCIKFLVYVVSFGKTHHLSHAIMPLKHLKSPASKAASNGSSVHVAGTVKKVLDDIQANGDQAVSKYSAQFDNWSPASFKLSQEQIDDAIAAVPSQTIEDIKTAQQNIRKFAEAQRNSLHEFELEIEPGVFLGQKNTPINRVGAWVVFQSGRSHSSCVNLTLQL